MARLKKINTGIVLLFSLFVFSALFGSHNLFSRELYIGASSIDITPPLPVSLDGQMTLRVAETAETPLIAGILVLENVTNNKKKVSIWISLDLVVITDKLRKMIWDSVRSALPDLDPANIIINATHTHTGPSIREGYYILPEGVLSIEETLEFITDRVVLGLQQAWEGRSPGAVSWGQGQAKLAVNRRAVYEDGSAAMYGSTDLPEFRGLEGYEDSDVDVLFFWDDKGDLLAACINVACPAQEVEGRSAVNADFWHPVREKLRETLSDDLVILGWIGAAGDQSPHLMYGKEADTRMRELRGVTRLEELARRIAVTVEDVYHVVKDDQYRDVELIHDIKQLQLPKLLVSLAGVNEAKKAISELEALDEEARLHQHRRIRWHQSVIDRYEEQQKYPDKTYDVEIHIVRLGDIVICTNPFELFTEYGIRMKSRSKALQTFVVQLVGPGNYLPTMEAIRGGHYSAIIQSNEVGPEAGDLLVEQTVRGINDLWKEDEKNE